AFLNDTSTDAYRKVVERLLASSRYGERWAQHWLDLVRFAETDGFKADDYRPDAHKYRDYVIRSFNADLPYDRFIRQQLAGEELRKGAMTKFRTEIQTAITTPDEKRTPYQQQIALMAEPQLVKTTKDMVKKLPEAKKKRFEELETKLAAMPPRPVAPQAMAVAD